MSKRIIVTLIIMCVCQIVFSQQDKAGIAPFKITMMNGKTYSYSQLKKNTPTILIYFSPTCDHCKAFTAELLKHEKQLANKQIIMVTYVPMEEIKPFDSTYHLSSKSFIKIGTEGYSFIVQKYYNVQKFPYIVLYDKNLKQVKKLSPADEPATLVKEIIAK